MTEELELRAFRFRKRSDSSQNNQSYKSDPFKFLWAYSGEKAKEKNVLVVNSSRVRMMWEHAQGKKVLGKVLTTKPPGLPRFGSLYQETGSNFILHSDNVTRVLQIPYFPKATRTRVVSPNSWYLDAIYWTFYICNLMNLIFSCVALTYFVKDTYLFYVYFSSDLNPMKIYLSLFLFMIIAVAFIFSIGHSMSKTHSLALIYLYIFLSMLANFVMIFFQEYYNFKERMHKDFRHDLKKAFLRGNSVDFFIRLQTSLRCCGVTSPADWEIIGQNNLPSSCCPLRDTDIESDAVEFTCEYVDAFKEPCAEAAIEVLDSMLSRHSYMLWGKILFQWLGVLMAMIYAIALYNGALDQKNNINYNSAVPVEFFNIVTKGEVEFCLPMSYYDKKDTEDYKYMILLNDIREAVNARQMKHFNERRFMLFDVV